jgi:hypothetical protein
VLNADVNCFLVRSVLFPTVEFLFHYFISDSLLTPYCAHSNQIVIGFAVSFGASPLEPNLFKPFRLTDHRTAIVCCLFSVPAYLRKDSARKKFLSWHSSRKSVIQLRSCSFLCHCFPAVSTYPYPLFPLLFNTPSIQLVLDFSNPINHLRLPSSKYLTRADTNCRIGLTRKHGIS